MTRSAGRNKNTYDDPGTPTPIVLNATTYTKLLDANENRIGYTISNPSQGEILIREKAFGDELDRGFSLFGRSGYEKPTDKIPLGEIWAKAASGSPSIRVTEE